MDSDADIIRSHFKHVSAATRAKNPHIYGDAGAGGLARRLPADKPERGERREGEDSGVEAGAAGVEYRVTFTVFRRRLLDNHDNARAALKPAVDIVTAHLGFKTDDHPRLHWEYHQVKTAGRQGTFVTVERRG